jgi:hypothetical protein
MSSLRLVFDGNRYTLAGVEHENTYGIVVFLDALGVKGIWETRDPAEVLNNWNKVYYIFSDELRHLSGTNFSAFSDTLIISVRGNERFNNNPIRFAQLLARALVPAFVRSMHYDFFFRGVICMNYFSRSTRMLIGPAVDDAAQFYEVANWSGIAISPSLSSVLEGNTETAKSTIIVPYSVPQGKTDYALNWAVNWTGADSYGRCRNILIEKCRTYADKYNVSHDFSDYNVYLKFKNTLDFYTHCSNTNSS